MTGTIKSPCVSGQDGVWKYQKFNDGTYHAWYEGLINLQAGTAWLGGYFHRSTPDLDPPSFSTHLTSITGAANGAQLMIYAGRASDGKATYWLNGNSAADASLQVRIDMYGLW